MKRSLTIQSAVRVYLTRKSYLAMKAHHNHIQLTKTNQAATVIQSAARSWKCQRDLTHRIQTTSLFEESIKSGNNTEEGTLLRVDQVDNPQPLTSGEDAFFRSVVSIQARARGFVLRKMLSKANHAARLIQNAWRKCVISLRMKLLQVFELACSQDTTHSISKIPSPMKKARALLPRDSHSLNRIRDITPLLPRHSGVFVEEIMNSVTVVIQSAARRYLAKKKLLRLHQAKSTADDEDQTKLEEQERVTLRFSTDDENMLILDEIYQRARLHADAVEQSSYNSDTSIQCILQYAEKFIHAIVDQEL